MGGKNTILDMQRFREYTTYALFLGKFLILQQKPNFSQKRKELKK